MKKHGWWVITLAIILALVAFLMVQARKPGKHDTFAQCVNDSGAIFYGAWWCPHCQATKAMFGKSSKLLPYVECSDKSQKQTQECDDVGIKGYPTWIFKDESRLTGELTFQQIAEKTSCEFTEPE